MNICICDDELEVCKKIEFLCHKYFDNTNQECEIFYTDNGYEVEREAQKIDLIILDIEMPIVNGIILKDSFQRKKLDTYILFVTQHESLMENAFGANVIGFIKKDLLENKLYRYLQLASNLARKDFLIDDKYHSSQVIYINSEKEYCKLHFLNKQSTLIRYSLKKLAQELEDYDFIMLSRSYVVNMKYVVKCEKDYFWINDEKIKIARRNLSSAKEAYEKFCERNAKYC